MRGINWGSDVNDTRVETLTASSVSVALKFFSSMPSSRASVSLYGPFRIKTRLPADRLTPLASLTCRTWMERRKRGLTRGRDDRFQVVLVQFQFVPGVDQLHHGSVSISHLLFTKAYSRQQREASAPAVVSSSQHRYRDNGLLLVVFLSQFFGDHFHDNVGLQPVVGSGRLLLLPLLHLNRNTVQDGPF